jgi:pyruvate/2-oxoglutarate dehydrogenase complex dihydrolipoamide acyltransferase (E2) component
MLDKLGIMPNAVVEASPFHTSCFVTNLKSIGTEHIYHHIYDFGTCGIFVAMGKEKMQPVVDENNNIVPAKIMKLGIVLDERLADGFYGAKSLKVAVKHMQNPSLLTERLESVMLDPDL